MVARPRLARAAIIATQDRDHVAPAAELAALGYDLLLEKPVAPELPECERLLQVVAKAGVRYVRGNWRRAALSSPMLLAKSSHDLDLITFYLGRDCRAVASFGSLMHFRRDQKPTGAGDALRCTQCAVEPHCAYSAPRIYGGMLAEGNTGWPVDVVAASPTPARLLEALNHGPYGRCVYECDNDVVDHQVVAMEFDGGATATFTLAGSARRGIVGRGSSALRASCVATASRSRCTTSSPGSRAPSTSAAAT